MPVRRLSDTIVNQIAAGEVVERPASVVRELLDNAIDASASRIEITTIDGGKSLMRVVDNGAGMGKEDLELAVERHCTSKLLDDLTDINSLGFRGEALPSIGSVARLNISSRLAQSPNGWHILVEGGAVSNAAPSAIPQGTIVEVADLFYATPARLKFMKTDRAESSAILDVVKRAVLGHPDIYFTVCVDERTPLTYPAVTSQDAQSIRARDVLGQDFVDNSIAIDAEREGVRLHGYTSLPTFNRGNSLHQFFYVNGRAVQDRQITGAIRGAYMDYLPRYRHPINVLFLEIDPALVDVNVHPAKAEVRFRDSGLVRGLIVGALKEALLDASQRASSEGAKDMLAAFRIRPSSPVDHPTTGGNSAPGAANYDWQSSPNRPFADAMGNSPINANGAAGFTETAQAGFDITGAPSADIRPPEEHSHESAQGLPLGAARAQLHQNYIIAQTDTGLVIVDQHAAHERLVYERMKAQIAQNGVAAQMLLIPDIVEMEAQDATRLLDHATAFERLGLQIESFGDSAIMVRSTPALLGEVDAEALLKDLADDIAQWGTTDLVAQKLDYVAATMACHGSVRSGRLLKPQEMDQLLRDMEATPNSGQCNHGRPTYVELKLTDIERLFGRR